MKKNEWTYHTSIKYKHNDGKEMVLMTQLYQAGVYGIINNDPSCQLNMTPQQLVNTEKRLKKALANKEIKDLTFGRSITVTNRDGMFKEVTT